MNCTECELVNYRLTKRFKHFEVLDDDTKLLLIRKTLDIIIRAYHPPSIATFLSNDRLLVSASL